ncbi:hypothetical protein EOPP23_14570 [Endozoicomonas sp. OPT23]|uniref:hypothetical protein n=1 Tax=Endozoicomonas sp. OPT23 TaxID=2072845 RepID=UPI00129B3A7A|nr:hypothetical protein [Endozoicomonas sp. OPT23]MRI34215.1 hypothetical protein [Endozoicomonas sp. OPT23]
MDARLKRITLVLFVYTQSYFHQIALASAEGNLDYVLLPLGKSDNTILPEAWNAPFNEITQLACHNCFETKYSESFIEALDYVKAVELDIWDTHYYGVGSGLPDHWYVRHNFLSGNNNNCGTGNGSLFECLMDIRLWSEQHPDHFPITLFLDKKQNWSQPSQRRSPKQLFTMLRKAFGSKLYKPRELLEFNTSQNITPAVWHWPTAAELSGRIIVVINGGSIVLDKVTSLLPYGNSTYNTELEKAGHDTLSANAFTGPYIFNIDEISSPINISSSIAFVNAAFNHNNIVDLDYMNYFIDSYKGRLLRVWNAEGIPFCELRKTKLNYVAYYDFKAQLCNGYSVWVP